MIITAPRFKPSAGASIDWGGSLANRLAFAALLQQGAAGDYVAGNKPTYNTAAATPPVGIGSHLFFAGNTSTSSFLNYGTGGYNALSSAPFTMFFRLYAIPAGVNATGLLDKHDNNTIGAGVQVWAGCETVVGGGGYGFVIENTSIPMVVKCSDNIPQNRWCNLVYVYSGNNTNATSGGHKLFVDGVQATNLAPRDGVGTTGTSNADSLTIGRARVAFGGGSPTASGFGGYIDAAYIWRRMLSITEIQLLQSTPYAPFAWNSVRRLVQGSSGVVVTSTFPALTVAL